MARQIREWITDDIDNTEGASTVTFSINGDQYEIDLSDKNIDNLRKVLAPFILAARPVRQEKSAKLRRGATSSRIPRERTTQIRAWAKAQGLGVSERGRISSSIVEQFEAVH